MVSHVDHPAIACAYCDGQFKPKNIRRTFCYTVECQRAHKNAKIRAYTAMVKERDGISPTQKSRPPRALLYNCTVCGEQMKRYGGAEAPVHKTCRRPHQRKQGLLHERFQLKIDKAAQGTNGGKRVFTSGPCPWCGEHFTAAGGVYCSSRCKTAARFKRRGRGFTFIISPAERQKIYERDGWMCQICMHPVDRALGARNKWSATLDHIEPQSSTLIPDHSPSNLRLAHMWCNAARGDGSNMAKEELVTRASELYLKAA